MKFKVKHPLDLPETVREWWQVTASWDSSNAHHLFSTLEDATTYAQKRVDALVKARANSKKHLPLVTKCESGDQKFGYGVVTEGTVCRHSLGCLLLDVPVWDHDVTVSHCKRV